MNVALCVTFLEEGIWENLLRSAAFPQIVEIIEYNSATSLLPVMELKIFSFLVVVLNGVAGLDAVRQLRSKSHDVPIIWVSNDDFSRFAYEYHVTYFLRKPVSETELKEVVAGCVRIGKEHTKT